MFIFMGQPGYSLLSRLGRYTHWLHLYNDNINKRHIKHEYNSSLKFNIYFFFKYSVILFKNHWLDYSRVFNVNQNRVIKNKKKYYYNIINWKYKISHFTLLTKQYYTFTKFKSISVDSEIYIISFCNYLCIYWFWAHLKKSIKKKKIHKFRRLKKKYIFKKKLSQFVYISVIIIF